MFSLEDQGIRFFIWILFSILLINLSFITQVSHGASVAGLERRSVSLAANIGGSVALQCDVTYPTRHYTEHIMTWRKQNEEVPIFIQFDGYPPHIDEKYHGRIRLLQQSSIEISDVRMSDAGWYECSVVFLDSMDESNFTGSWIHLSVNAPPILGEVSPSFLIHKVGETVDIFCEATATPDPILTWQKDGKDIPPEDRIAMTTNRLQIRHLVNSDGGVYTCTFKNIVGSVTHTVKLVIEGPGWVAKGNAYIMLPPKNQTVRAGSRAKLTCQAEGYPNNITYSWFHNGNDVKRSGGLMSRAGIYADGSFVISSVSREDAGIYRCQPSNGLGAPPHAEAYLNVQYLPRVVSMPINVYLARGLIGRVKCNVDANPPHTRVEWLKNDVSLDPSQSERIWTERDGSLVIKSVNKSDEGRYACTPYSQIGIGATSLPVLVLVREPPHFTFRPFNVYQRRPTESVSFPCQAEGDPQPLITWRKAEGGFTLDSRILIDGGNMTITNLEKRDHGVYECVATNNATSIVTTTLLIVEDVTSHPPHNLSVTMSESTATIKWLPGYDGGFFQHYVLWYIPIQKQDLYAEEDDYSMDESARWQTLNIEPPNSTTVIIYDLQPGTAYQFMVMARNRLGEEQFSSKYTASTLPINMSEEMGQNSPPSSYSINRKLPPNSAPIISTNVNEDDDFYDDDDEFDLYDEGGGEDYDKKDCEYGLNEGCVATGLKPAPPVNVTVQQLPGGLNISWMPPRRRGAAKVARYTIEYKTVATWVKLIDSLPATTTHHLWTTASHGVMYYIRVISENSAAVRSESSNVETIFLSSPLSLKNSVTILSIGGMLGLLIFLLLTVIICVIICRFYIKRKRKERQRYSDVKYFGPNQPDGYSGTHPLADGLASCDLPNSDHVCLTQNHNSVLPYGELTVLSDNNYHNSKDRRAKETPI